MANFFNNVIAPQLNSTEYGQGIQDMVDTINDNFQKVFTLPFLQGDDGDMISTEFCPFWVQDNGVDYLTQEGAKIYNTIFETDKFYYSEGNRMTYNNFKNVLIDDLKLYSNGNPYNDISLFTNLYGPHKDPKILLFYKISSEDGVSETPLGSAQLYYYFDPRINVLSELITINNNDEDAKNYRQNFRDYTCILSTKYDSDDNYTYEKQSGWPTLYFDNSSKQYCWSINGQQTGVNAQGVNGKDGIGARIWVCQVELDNINSSQENYENGIMSQFIITKVFVPRDSQWYTKILDNNGVWNGKWLNEDNKEVDLKSYLGETNYFQQGDMAVCYLPNSENNYSDQMIGVINQNSSNGNFFVQASISQNTTNTFKNLSLFNLLSSIGKGEKDTPTTKGIFIPTTVGNNSPAHTLYEGGFNGQSEGLYLVKTDNRNKIKFDGEQISLNNNGDTFNVYYNTNIHGDFNIRDLLNFKYTYNVESYPKLDIIPSLYGDTDPQVNLGTDENRIGDIYVSNIYSENINSRNIISTSIKIDEISSNGNITLSKNIHPNKSNTISLGSEDKRFNNIYTKNFNASESLTIKKVDYNNGEVSKHYGQTFIKGGNFYINSTGDIKEDPDSNYVGLSYKDNDLIFCGNYDDRWGGNSSIPLIKSTRYSNSGKPDIATMIRFRNNGTQIYDKLFVGGDDDKLIPINSFKNEHTLQVNGKTLMIGVTQIKSETDSNTTSDGALTVDGGVGIVKNLNVGGIINSTGGYKIINSDSLNIDRYIPFCGYSNSTSSDLIKYYKDGFTFNPQTNTLKVGNLSITSGTESNATNNGALVVNGGVGIGGELNVGGATTLKSNLILNSITEGSGASAKYYSNKIIFQRGTSSDSSDNINDWYMYGNNSGQLEIGSYRKSNGYEPLLKLSRSDNGTKKMEVEAGITSKVSGINGVYTGMPVGTIIQWLDFQTSIPEGYVYWLNTSGQYRINSLFNTYLKNDGTKNKSVSSFNSTDDYLEIGSGSDQANKNKETVMGNKVNDLYQYRKPGNETATEKGNKFPLIDEEIKKGPVEDNYIVIFQDNTDLTRGTVNSINIPYVIWKDLKNIPVIFQQKIGSPNDSQYKLKETIQKYYLLNNESSLLDVVNNDEHKEIQRRILAGLFHKFGYDIVSKLRGSDAMFYFCNRFDDDLQYGYLFYNFNYGNNDNTDLNPKTVSFDFIQIYGKTLIPKIISGKNYYDWDGPEINIVGPVYDNDLYQIKYGAENSKFALNFQNFIDDREDIVGDHNLVKYL